MAEIVSANIANALNSLTGILGTADQIYGSDGEKNILEIIDDKVTDAKGAIPTKVSQLNNDSHYQTDTQVSNAISTAVATEQSRAEQAEHDLDSDISVLTNTVNGKQDKLTSSSVTAPITFSNNKIGVNFATNTAIGVVMINSSKQTSSTNAAVSTYNTTYINSLETKIDGKQAGPITAESPLKISASNAATPNNITIDTATTTKKGVVDAIKTAATATGSGTDTMVYSVGYINTLASKKADLGEDGKVPASQLPSYVDDVLEYAKKNNFPTTGESGKIYVDLNTKLIYRWSGSAYVEISPSIALGTTSSTAFPGDRGLALETKVTNLENNKQDKISVDVPLTLEDNKISLSVKNTKYEGSDSAAFPYSAGYINSQFSKLNTALDGKQATISVTAPITKNNNTIGVSKASVSNSKTGVVQLYGTKQTNPGLTADYSAYNLTYVNNAIDSVENRLIILEEAPTATITASPTTIYAGENQSVTGTFNFTTKSGSYPLGNVTMSIAGTTATTTQATITGGFKYTGTATVNTAAGTKTVTASGKYTIGGKENTISKSVNITAVNAVWYGSASSPTSPTSLTKLAAATSPKTTYTITIANNNEYAWIFVPTARDTLSVDKFTMGGAPVAMKKENNQTVSGVAYSVYHTEATYTKNTKLVITAS